MIHDLGAEVESAEGSDDWDGCHEYIFVDDGDIVADLKLVEGLGSEAATAKGSGGSDAAELESLERDFEPIALAIILLRDTADVVVLEVEEDVLHLVLAAELFAAAAGDELFVDEEEADEFIVDDESELFDVEFELDGDLADAPGSETSAATSVFGVDFAEKAFAVEREVASVSCLVVDLGEGSDGLTDTLEDLEAFGLALLLVFGEFEFFPEFFVDAAGAIVIDAPDGFFEIFFDFGGCLIDFFSEVDSSAHG